MSVIALAPADEAVVHRRLAVAVGEVMDDGSRLAVAPGGLRLLRVR